MFCRPKVNFAPKLSFKIRNFEPLHPYILITVIEKTALQQA